LFQLILVTSGSISR